MEEALKEIIPLAVEYGVRLLGALIALWVSFRVANWISTKLIKSLRARKFDETLAVFFGGLVRYLVLVAAILAILGMFGIETTSFAAIIGAAGLAIGLAFQGTLANFAAGVMIMVFRPFSVGDYVVMGGNEGIVREIGLFVCALDTLDNRRVIMPNATATGGVIENYTSNPLRRVDINVGVSYSSDIPRVRQVLDAAAKTVPHRDEKHGHQIFLAGLGASAVEFQVRIWTDPQYYWDVWDLGTEIVKKSLDQAGITIPFPQMDVHVNK
ncbi:MAG: mechanosensitive ion channel [Myxococcales bacterium]|nr:mechanosensitive ion channel [Myxococcales bacterium]